MIITIQKGATIKIVVASCQPLNSLMNFTLIAVTSTSNFNNFIGSIGKENICKLLSLSLKSPFDWKVHRYIGKWQFLSLVSLNLSHHILLYVKNEIKEAIPVEAE